VRARAQSSYARRVSRAAVSIAAFGVYLVLLGLAVVIAPNPVIALCGLPATGEVWIRVAGFLAGAIGYYYLRAARGEVRPFFHWTVHARALVPPLFAGFVLMKLARPGLLLLAAGDAAGATWTWLALRSDGRSDGRSAR
jgi:hypothetical protein